MNQRLQTFAEYYDRIYLNMNDYEKEAEIIRSIVRRFERVPSQTLLDIGCGTGEHLKHLSGHFRSTGLDLSREMIDTARSKAPGARFEVADMMNFRMAERFDVITCLFSAIGYVRNRRNLAKTLSNFHDHLSETGLAIVEPWVFRKDYLPRHVGLETYEDEKVKLVRMSASKLTKSNWRVYFHYLIGSDGTVEYTRETHVMISAEYEDYIDAFRKAGFSDVSYLKEEWPRARGLFIATK